MSPEEQRMAIAEWCGIKLVGFYPHPIAADAKPVPFYCDDLNAMHEAELRLTEKQREQYENRLQDDRYDSFEWVPATAAQRAEALLRTIGKWTDSNRHGA